jgi:hypothetical protein
MRTKSYQIIGDRLKLAQSVADGTFVTDGQQSAGSAVAPKAIPGPCEATPVTGNPLNAGPDPPSPLPTASPPRQYGAVRHRNREGEGNPKLGQSAADEILLTEQQLANRWQVSPKTLRNARVQGRLISFLKIGRIIRYRLSVVIAVEEDNWKRSTSGGEQ